MFGLSKERNPWRRCGLPPRAGVARQRYSGTTKLLSNTELRIGQETTLAAVAFLDAGLAFSSEVDDGPWWRNHLAGGLGLRVVRRAAALHLDVGISANWTAVYATLGQLL